MGRSAGQLISFRVSQPVYMALRQMARERGCSRANEFCEQLVTSEVAEWRSKSVAPSKYNNPRIKTRAGLERTYRETHTSAPWWELKP